jgi:hypothetical protein
MPRGNEFVRARWPPSRHTTRPTNADLARLQQVSQVLFKKSENFVKGDREIVSGCMSEGE